MNENSVCSTRLLSDSPAQTDAFGSHERVAKAIVQLMRNDSGGKSIALTGSWGSGKSTVVEMVKTGVDPDTKVFVFDAWAHEGDPLRRTFLEQLLDFFTENGWIKDGEWEEDKLKLSRKIRNQKIKSTPILTTAGKLFGLSALLVPLGIVMVSISPSEDVPSWMLWVGAVFALSPLLLAIGLLILHYIYNKMSSYNKTPKFLINPFKVIYNKIYNDDKKENDGILLFLINRYRTIEESDTIETPDPTSIEFQDFFKRLLKSALISDGRRKLLIVIDNLDRIDARDALKIWATMRAFFDFNSDIDRTGLSRLWLLVPFDPSALNRLWHSDGDEKTDATLVQSFTDKSFQIKFDVAPPVSSAWKDFLLDQLTEAFPDHNRADFHAVYRLYRLRGLADKKLPTPRDLKLFVNQIGTLHRQWYDEIPLSIQALYVILQRNAFDFENDLINIDDILNLNANELQLIGSDYQKFLAALHFNVEVDKSLQILLGPRIEKAIDEGDGKAIKRLCNLPGFAQVCEHVIGDQSEDWSRGEGRTFCIAADTLPTPGQIDDRSWKEVWGILCAGVENVPHLGALDEKVGRGIVQLLKHRQNRNFAQLITTLIAKSAKSVPELKEDDQQIEPTLIEDWIKGVFIVFMELLDINYQDVINKHFCIDCSARTYIEIISHLGENSEWDTIQPYFKTTAASTEVITELVGASNSGSFNDAYSNAVAVMSRTKQDWTWNELITALNQRLQVTDNVQPPEIKANIKTLLYLEKEGESQAGANLGTLASQGHLLHHFHQVRASNDVETMALCLIPLLRTIPDGNVQQDIGNSAAGLNAFNAIMKEPDQHPEIVEKFADLTVELSLIEDLIELSKKAPNTSNFVNAAMEVVAKRHDAPDSLDRVLVSHGFDDGISGIYIIRFKTIEEENRQEFVKFLIDGIRGVDKNTWFSELQSGGDLLKLLIDMVESGIQLDLTTTVQDALLDHAESLIGSNTDIQFFEDKWRYVYDALDDDSKSTFLRNLRDKIIESDKPTDSILKVYGELLKDCDTLNENTDTLVRQGFKRFIEKMNISELKWLSGVISTCPKILTTCKSSSKKDFERRVIEAGNGELDEETQTILESIATQLGIPLPKEEKVDENDSQ